MFETVVWSILTGIAWGLTGYIVACLIASIDDVIWPAIRCRARISWSRRTVVQLMRYGAALSVLIIPMAAIAVPVAAHTSSLLAAAMLFVGTLLPLPFIYVRAFGWVWPLAESSQPGLEWSAWEYYDHRSNYYLENGR